MIEVTKFSVSPPSDEFEMAVELGLRFTNNSREPIRKIQYHTVFTDWQEHPLESVVHANEECNLAPGESIDVFKSLDVDFLETGTGKRQVHVVVCAACYARDVTNFGEVDVPCSAADSSTLERAVRSSAIEGTAKGLVARGVANESGEEPVGCCLSLLCASEHGTLWADLNCDLLDADGSVVESDVGSNGVQAGWIGFLQCNLAAQKGSILSGAKVRLLLSVFRPIEYSRCESVTEFTAEDQAAEEPAASGDDASDSQENANDQSTDCSEVDDDSDEEAVAVGDRLGDDETASEGDDVGRELDPLVYTILAEAAAEEWAGAFAENQITACIADQLTDADLLSMGIAALGVRKRILVAVANRSTTRSPTGDGTPSSSRQGSIDWERLILGIRSLFEGQGSVTIEPELSHKRFIGSLKYAGPLEPDARPLLVYDDTLFRSGKDGAMATTLGLHWRNGFSTPCFRAWGAIRSAVAVGKAVQLDPGGVIKTAFGGVAVAQSLASFINSAAAASAAGADDSHPQRDEISQAISEMRARDQDGFVAIEGPNPDEFVQFCNGEAGVVMDVPMRKGVNTDHERAAAFLGQFGFVLEEHDGGESYQREFEDEAIEEMLSITIRSFQGLFALPPMSQLRVRRGWA